MMDWNFVILLIYATMLVAIATNPPTVSPTVAVAGTYQPTVTPVTTAKYCATFNPQTAAGASGYFAMEIVNGQAYYAYEIDLSKFGYLTGTCSQTLSAGGLKYHIHSYWKNASTTSSAQDYERPRGRVVI